MLCLCCRHWSSEHIVQSFFVECVFDITLNNISTCYIFIILLQQCLPTLSPNILFRKQISKLVSGIVVNAWLSKFALSCLFRNYPSLFPFNIPVRRFHSKMALTTNFKHSLAPVSGNIARQVNLFLLPGNNTSKRLCQTYM